MKKILASAFLLLGWLIVVYSQESTVCYNEQVTINLQGYSGKGSIQWQQSSNQTTWTDISGQISEKLIVTATSNLYYRATVKEGTCNPYISQVSKVFIITLPDKANAGSDIVLSNGTTTTMAANAPINGSGLWTITQGTGGQFDDATKPTAIFSGIANQQYMLKWTITNDCGNSEADYVGVYFGSLTIGMNYGGGIIYTLSDAQHGVIVTSSSLGSATWGCFGTSLGASSTTNGEANTEKISASCTDRTAAGNMCSDYVSNFYDNWFLPSQDEIRNFAGSSIGLDKNLKWWSSSEWDGNNALYVEFKSAWGIGSWIPTSNNKGNVVNVRCFRNF